MTAGPAAPAVAEPDAPPAAARRARVRRAAVVLVVLLAGSVTASMLVGAGMLAPATVADALFGDGPVTPESLVVTDVRLPRTVLALLAGAALGVAGVLAQGMTRNPIAEPGLLGLNTGAALAVVLGIGVFGVSTLTGYVWFGFLGAALAAVVVGGVAGVGRSSRTVSPAALALAGAAVAAGLGSVITVFLLTNPTLFDDYRFWQVGSVAGRDLSIAAQAAPFVVAGLALALTCGQRLDALALGDDVARSFGRRPGADRLVCGLALVLLAGTATAAAGPIAFVGLAVPHVLRALTGPGHRTLLPLAVLAGPSLLLLADVLGRVVVPPAEVQAGVVTAVVGVPLFVALVRRRKFVR
ncbi:MULTISPECIES: iron chelate uptake ABC transporter family permease subunit [unclassified Pseudonocardia]|uniref:FecCD family ABC transporter permease n=1 Tax=unclassified Pseudonocardia TaxID=2619320 RepID=UPI000968A06E|nr:MULTISPECIES: iron chelate uptake ABC transporter family permease subunit [unclassified Pseudonocardia]OLM16968.1 ABC-type Fe3+-siderophore transport system, permease component [Pseudonocardia sp. Ae707_Ps1]